MHKGKTMNKSQRLWEQKYYLSYHINSLSLHVPDYFVDLNITPATLPFPTGFPHLLKIPLIFINLQSLLLKESFLPIDEVLLPLKYKKQRQSHQ